MEPGAGSRYAGILDEFGPSRFVVFCVICETLRMGSPQNHLDHKLTYCPSGGRLVLSHQTSPGPPGPDAGDSPVGDGQILRTPVHQIPLKRANPGCFRCLGPCGVRAGVRPIAKCRGIIGAFGDHHVRSRFVVSLVGYRTGYYHMGDILPTT